MLRELFRLNLSNFGLGLPALAGVALGIRLYTGDVRLRIHAAAILLALWLFVGLARVILVRAPRLGTWLVEAWIAAAVLVTGFITYFILWLTLGAPFPSLLGSPTGDTLTKLSATLVGAVTTFTALVWTKDIADGKGYFWPSTQFRYGIEALYKHLAAKPAGNTLAYNAIFMDSVPDTDIEGWSFPNRHARARIASDYMRAQRARPRR